MMLPIKNSRHEWNTVFQGLSVQDAVYSLPLDEIHVWHLSHGIADTTTLLPLLSPDEISRAQRYVWPQVRDRFIMTRIFLRVILAKYTDCLPQQIQFCYSKFGKPGLVDRHLQFNISHTDNRVAVAVAHSPIGIDIETIRSVSNIDSIAAQYFSPQEAYACRAIRNEPDKSSLFLKLWTRKEAQLKALGVGLSQPSQPFDGVCTSFSSQDMLAIGAVASQEKDLTIRHMDLRW